MAQVNGLEKTSNGLPSIWEGYIIEVDMKAFGKSQDLKVMFHLPFIESYWIRKVEK